jgi:serine/threonine protein kinase
VRDEIASEAARRAGIDEAARAALVARVQASPMSIIAALLIEGLKADDIILATCAVTGLAPAPRLLLRKPQLPRRGDLVGVRDAGGTPIGTVQGRTWVAFSDPEAARAAVFSDDVVVCVATDADLRVARQRFEDAHPDGAAATMDVAALQRAGVPQPAAPQPAVPKPAPEARGAAHAALPELRPVEDTVRAAPIADTVEGLSQVDTIVAGMVERTAVTPAPLARQEVAVVDAERGRLQRVALLGRLKRFRLERILGSGGMATVYLAVDKERGGPPVAVKVLAAHLQDDPLAVGRFRREVRALMALRHRHIVALVDGDAEAEGGARWLACRFLDGGTLRDLLGRTGPLPWVAALPIIGALLEGEAYAHAAGVVHRDLKPQNILLDHDGSLCIADFGVASAVGDVPLTSAGTRFGTPAYMSPEQALGAPIDNRSDLFSTGAILYELLAGQAPFARASALDTMRAVAAGDAAPLPPVVVVPDAVRHLLQALLEVAPQRRPPDAEAALRVLRPFLTRCPPIEEVVRRLLSDPRAFVEVAPADDSTVAGDAPLAASADMLGGPTRDIEALAAGFDDGDVAPVTPRAPPPALPTSAPALSLSPSSSLPVLAPTAPRPTRPGRFRAAASGFGAVLIVGALVLAVVWWSR